VTRECHAGICEGRGVRLPPATRRLIFPHMFLFISAEARAQRRNERSAPVLSSARPAGWCTFAAAAMLRDLGGAPS